jgi:hypothetical protein
MGCCGVKVVASSWIGLKWMDGSDGILKLFYVWKIQYYSFMASTEENTIVDGSTEGRCIVDHAAESL